MGRPERRPDPRRSRPVVTERRVDAEPRPELGRPQGPRRNGRLHLRPQSEWHCL